MTLTLRLYDDSGTEVAWVTADPYEWSITHPSPGDYDGLRPVLEGWGRPSDDSGAVDTQNVEFGLTLDPFPGNIDPAPQDHLEMIQESLEGSYVASASIADE